MPDAYQILKDAITAVPAVKYALGVLGIVAVLAIVKGFKIGWKVAVYGTVILLGMMVLLVVFARYTEMADPSIRYAVVVLTWSMLTLFDGLDEVAKPRQWGQVSR